MAAFYGDKIESKLEPVVSDSKVMMGGTTCKDKIILV